MATQPHPTPPPPKPAPPKPEPHPENHHAAHETPPLSSNDVAKPEPKPVKPDPSMKTTADEQRERAAEIEKVGADAWIKAHDERTEEEKQPKAVTGVAQPSKAEVEGHKR